MNTTTETTIGEQIYQCLKNIITPQTEENYIKSLISELYTRGVNPETTEQIIKTLYSEIIKNNQNNDKNWEWADYEIYLDEIYLEDESPNNGLDGLNVWLTGQMKKHEALHIINELKNILRKYESNNTYDLRIASDKYIVMNQSKKCVESKIVRTTNKGDNTKFETIINAYPDEIIIHDSPINEMGRTFTFKWQSRTSTRTFETKQSTISEIETYLQEAGWVINPKHLRGSLAAMIDIAITNKLATIKTDIDNPGFYWDTKEKKLIKVNVDLPEWENGGLKKGLNVLSELEKESTMDLSKLASGLKWGLVAPFNYARKQYGAGWMPWLFLQGKAKSGKTTVGLIILYLWSLPNEEVNNIGGSGFDTPARVGEKLGISTLPLLVNEPEGALEKPAVMGLIKSAIESTVARGKFRGGKYTNLPSFSPTIITSNPILNQEDAVLRRFHLITFSHNEKQDKETAKKFEKKFGFANPSNSMLLELHYLASFVYSELSEDTDLLDLDWQELADTLLLRAYAEVGEEVPTWLRLWYKSTSLEDLDDEEIESIRMFLFDEINRNSKQIKIYKESGYPEQETTLDVNEFSDTDDFRQRVWNVLDKRLISWCGVRQTRDGENQVFFTTGMTKAMGNIVKSCKSLKSIAELLDWDYTQMRIPKKTRVMIINFDDFVEFLNPTFEDFDDGT